MPLSQERLDALFSKPTKQTTSASAGMSQRRQEQLDEIFSQKGSTRYTRPIINWFKSLISEEPEVIPDNLTRLQDELLRTLPKESKKYPEGSKERNEINKTIGNILLAREYGSSKYLGKPIPEKLKPKPKPILDILKDIPSQAAYAIPQSGLDIINLLTKAKPPMIGYEDSIQAKVLDRVSELIQPEKDIMPKAETKLGGMVGEIARMALPLTITSLVTKGLKPTVPRFVAPTAKTGTGFAFSEFVRNFKDLEQGKISEEEFNKATTTSFVTGGLLGATGVIPAKTIPTKVAKLFAEYGSLSFPTFQRITESAIKGEEDIFKGVAEDLAANALLLGALKGVQYGAGKIAGKEPPIIAKPGEPTIIKPPILRRNPYTDIPELSKVSKHIKESGLTYKQWQKKFKDEPEGKVDQWLTSLQEETKPFKQWHKDTFGTDTDIKVTDYVDRKGLEKVKVSARETGRAPYVKLVKERYLKDANFQKAVNFITNRKDLTKEQKLSAISKLDKILKRTETKRTKTTKVREKTPVDKIIDEAKELLGLKKAKGKVKPKPEDYIMEVPELLKEEPKPEVKAKKKIIEAAKPTQEEIKALLSKEPTKGLIRGKKQPPKKEPKFESFKFAKAKAEFEVKQAEDKLTKDFADILGKKPPFVEPKKGKKKDIWEEVRKVLQPPKKEPAKPPDLQQAVSQAKISLSQKAERIATKETKKVPTSEAKKTLTQEYYTNAMYDLAKSVVSEYKPGSAKYKTFKPVIDAIAANKPKEYTLKLYEAIKSKERRKSGFAEGEGGKLKKEFDDLPNESKSFKNWLNSEFGGIVIRGNKTIEKLSKSKVKNKFTDRILRYSGELLKYINTPRRVLKLSSNPVVNRVTNLTIDTLLKINKETKIYVDKLETRLINLSHDSQKRIMGTMQADHYKFKNKRIHTLLELRKRRLSPEEISIYRQIYKANELVFNLLNRELAKVNLSPKEKLQVYGMPFTRHGDWVVSVRRIKGNKLIYFPSFSSEGKAIKWINRYKQRAGKDVAKRLVIIGPVRLDPAWRYMSQRSELSTQAIDSLSKRLGVSADTIFNIIEESSKKISMAKGKFTKHLLKRKGIAGYTTEPRQVMMDIIDHLRGIIKYANNTVLRKRFSKELAKLSDETEGSLKGLLVDYIDHVTGKDSVMEIVMRNFPNVNSGLNYSLRVMTHMMLGTGNLLYAGANLLSMLFIALPGLMGEKRADSAIKWLGIAHKKLLSYMAKRADKELSMVMKRGLKEDVIEPTIFHHIAERKALSTIENISSFFGKTTEHYNRSITLIAAYYMFKKTKPGVFDKNAYRRAVEIIWDFHGGYGIPGETGLLLRGDLGRFAFTFKKWSVGFFEVYAKLFNQAIHGNPHAAMGFLTGLGMLLLLAGVKGFPFSEAIDALTYKMTGYSPIDEAVKDLPDWAVYGMFSKLGIDVTKRVGVGNIIPYPLSLYETSIPINLMVRLSKAIKNGTTTNEWEDTFAVFSPSQFRNYIKTIISDKNADELFGVDYTGKQITELSTMEKRLAMGGLRPLKVSKVIDKKRAMDRIVAASERIFNIAIDIGIAGRRKLEGGDSEGGKELLDKGYALIMFNQMPKDKLTSLANKSYTDTKTMYNTLIERKYRELKQPYIEEKIKDMPYRQKQNPELQGLIKELLETNTNH